MFTIFWFEVVRLDTKWHNYEAVYKVTDFGTADSPRHDLTDNVLLTDTAVVNISDLQLIRHLYLKLHQLIRELLTSTAFSQNKPWKNVDYYYYFDWQLTVPFIAIPTYGCESCVLTREMKSKFETLEMKSLRRVKGITQRDSYSPFTLLYNSIGSVILCGTKSVMYHKKNQYQICIAVEIDFIRESEWRILKIYGNNLLHCKNRVLQCNEYALCITHYLTGNRARKEEEEARTQNGRYIENW